eukprot:TRINITY_DN3594_c0_g2_i4.p1 TRINITY_DN3594_c0_g2~~TRINITY_DN3594_c0_g2_i4.p1  ORF type:complete len:548 (-),score=75.58 TRINITY_DN3594_c0_g2_i4:734-2377(-)
MEDSTVSSPKQSNISLPMDVDGKFLPERMESNQVNVKRVGGKHPTARGARGGFGHRHDDGNDGYDKCCNGCSRGCCNGGCNECCNGWFVGRMCGRMWGGMVDVFEKGAAFEARHHVSVRVGMLVVMVGVAAVLAAYKYRLSLEDEHKSARLYFSTTAQTAASAMATELRGAGTYHVQLVNAVLAQRRIPRADEYRRFCDARVLWTITDVIRGQALAIRTPRADRSRLEAWGRAVHGPGFGLRVRNSSQPGSPLVPAPVAPLHFPILYIEPLASNAAAVGFDLYSEPMRRAAIDRAMLTAQLTPSNRVLLVQSTRLEYSSIVVRAFYRRPLPNDTIAPDWANCRPDAQGTCVPPGYVSEMDALLAGGEYLHEPADGAVPIGIISGAYVYQRILSSATKDIELVDVDVVLYLLDSPAKNSYLAHVSGPASFGSSHQGYSMSDLEFTDPGYLDGDIRRDFTFEFGSRNYRIEVIARTGYYENKSTSVPLTLLLVSLLGSFIGQTATIVSLWYYCIRRKRNNSVSSMNEEKYNEERHRGSERSDGCSILCL